MSLSQYQWDKIKDSSQSYSAARSLVESNEGGER